MIGVWDGRYMYLCGGVTVWFTDGYLNILPTHPDLSLQGVQLPTRMVILVVHTHIQSAD